MLLYSRSQPKSGHKFRLQCRKFRGRLLCKLLGALPFLIAFVVFLSRFPNSRVMDIFCNPPNQPRELIFAVVTLVFILGRTCSVRFEKAFGSFCRAVGSWHNRDPEVKTPSELFEAFRSILQVPFFFFFFFPLATI